VALQASSADLGALQILQDADRTVFLFRSAAQAFDIAGMIGVRIAASEWQAGPMVQMILARRAALEPARADRGISLPTELALSNSGLGGLMNFGSGFSTWSHSKK
jgi:hypothetical protein